VTNGFGYSLVEGITFTAGVNGASTTAGIAFDLDWDGVINAASQSNTFLNCLFGGAQYGLTMANTGHQMCSENTIINCYVTGVLISGTSYTTGGISANAANALSQTVIGGNIAGCQKGILVPAGGGSINTIHGTAFQNNTLADISIEAAPSGADCYSIKGCRTESLIFLRPVAGCRYHIAGCYQTNGTAGYFFKNTNGNLIIDSCWSVNGAFDGFNGTVYLRNNKMQSTTLLSTLSAQIVHWDTINDSFLVADLPAAAANLKGCRIFVTNSNIAATGNFATNISGHGGGTNTVPVWCDGTNWLIG
jgi:hypothetical protein